MHPESASPASTREVSWAKLFGLVRQRGRRGCLLDEQGWAAFLFIFFFFSPPTRGKKAELAHHPPGSSPRSNCHAKSRLALAKIGMGLAAAPALRCVGSKRRA